VPSPDEVVDFALSEAARAMESIRAFAKGDPQTIDAADCALLDRRVASNPGEPTTWPGDHASWAIHQAAFDLILGIQDRNDADGKTI
jgi:hypothetical protein